MVFRCLQVAEAENLDLDSKFRALVAIGSLVCSFLCVYVFLECRWGIYILRGCFLIVNYCQLCRASGGIMSCSFFMCKSFGCLCGLFFSLIFQNNCIEISYFAFFQSHYLPNLYACSTLILQVCEMFVVCNIWESFVS